MAWFKVDDGFHSSRKILSIPRRNRFAAIGLWALAGSWCADQLTDGHVPDYMLKEWGVPPSAPQNLVDAGLWSAESGGFAFRNWHEYQPSKQDVDAERAASRARMADLRAKRKQPKPLEQREDGEVFGRTVTNGSENVRNPDPSRPDPTLLGVKREATKAAPTGRTGTPIPNGFTATTEMIGWALENTPNINWQSSTEKFKAHYRSAAGPGQFKTDWGEAWKAWLLGDQERAETRPQQFKTKAEQNLDAGRALMDQYLANPDQLAIGGTE